MGDKLSCARPFPMWRVALATTALLALAGCESGPGGMSGTDATAALARPATAGLADRDVEAPEVFQRDETGLWDGRPSLGGVWVAHPDADDPERVLIRNAANGEYVIGALFRRERDVPGPRFQVSSDAAGALGMLAGAPTELQVVALRRREVAPAEGPSAEDPSAEADIAETLPAPGDDDGAETGTAGALAEDHDAEPRRRGLFGLFGARAAAAPAAAQGAGSSVAAEEAPGEAEDEIVAAAPAAPEAEGATVAAAAENGATQRRGGFLGLFGGGRTDAPLSALAPADAAEVTTVALATEPDTRPREAGTPTRAHVQIGIFSVEGNARDTAAKMRHAGLSPTVHEEKSQEKSFWRVTVGPATSETERAALVAQVREMGFADAYSVTR